MIESDYIPVKYTYHDNSSINTEQHFNKNGELHRVGKPAYIEYYPDGKLFYERHIINGLSYRLDGPYEVEYSRDGNMYYEYYSPESLTCKETGIKEIYYRLDGTKHMEYFVDPTGTNSQVLYKKYNTDGTLKYTNIA